MFGISRQAVYQSLARLEFRKQEQRQVVSLVDQVRREMPRVGTRKLYFLLKSDIESLGIKMGRDALFDCLRSRNMLVKPKKSYTKTTHSKHWLRKHPNLYKDIQISGPEEVFVSDITYVKSAEQTHYLALVTDAYSRKIMGYHLSDDLAAESVVKALKMATQNKRRSISTIHHSDRGIQYCSDLYQKELKRNKIIPSMTDGYDCYQNALAERINGILKDEFLIYKCKNKKDLKSLIKGSICTYNNRRPHLSLNMKTPNFIHEKTVKKISTV